MSGGVMLPPFVVAPLIQTLRGGLLGLRSIATTQGFRHPWAEHLSSSDWRPVVRDFVDFVGPRDRLEMSLDLSLRESRVPPCGCENFA